MCKVFCPRFFVRADEFEKQEEQSGDIERFVDAHDGSGVDGILVEQDGKQRDDAEEDRHGDDADVLSLLSGSSVAVEMLPCQEEGAEGA